MVVSILVNDTNKTNNITNIPDELLLIIKKYSSSRIIRIIHTLNSQLLYTISYTFTVKRYNNCPTLFTITNDGVICDEYKRFAFIIFTTLDSHISKKILDDFNVLSERDETRQFWFELKTHRFYVMLDLMLNQKSYFNKNSYNKTCIHHVFYELCKKHNVIDTYSIESDNIFRYITEFNNYLTWILLDRKFTVDINYDRIRKCDVETVRYKNMITFHNYPDF